MVKQREYEPFFASVLGLKQSNAPTNMPQGCLLDVLNMNLDGIGGKSTRNGYQEYFHLTNGIAGARVHELILSLIQFKPTTGGTNQTLAFAKDTIYQKNPSGTDTSIVRSSLSSDVRWNFVQYNDFIFGVNGVDTSFMWDAGDSIPTYNTISITAPTTHVTLTDSGVGTLGAGAYKYLVTFYDNVLARESAPFTITTAPSVTVAANRAITLSNFPSVTSGEGVTHFRIYRMGPAETIYTLTHTEPIASATYVDSGDATGTISLTGASGPYDNGSYDVGYTALPSDAFIIEEAFDRLFAVSSSNPTMLLFSQAGGKQFAWPSGNFLPIGRNDGSPILDLHKHSDSLAIHKRNSWWLLDGDPVTNNPRRISGVGTQDIACSASDDNNVLRLTPSGFYLSTPTGFDVNDLREDYNGMDVATEQTTIDWNATEFATLISYKKGNLRHLYAMFPNFVTYTTKVLVYQTALKEWVKYEIGTDVSCAAKYEDDNESKMMFGDSYGMVWEWDVGDSDGTDLLSDVLNGTFTAVGNTTFEDTSVLDDSGTATSGGASTLTDTSKNWGVNTFVNSQLYIASGTGAGQTVTIASNTANELTITGVWSVQPDATSVYQIGGWTVNGLIGVLVTTREGVGADAKRRIESNTPCTAVIATAWSTNPNTSTTYSIGAMDKYGEEFWNSNSDQHIWKRMRWIIPYVRQDGDYPITVSFRRDFKLAADTVIDRVLNVFRSASLWGVFLWGVGTFGSAVSDIRRLRLAGKYRFYSVKYRNNLAGEPFNWDGHGAVFQRLYDRN